MKLSERVGWSDERDEREGSVRDRRFWFHRFMDREIPSSTWLHSQSHSSRSRSVPFTFLIPNPNP